jgi:Flp pilus assembly pilin Flp
MVLAQGDTIVVPRFHLLDSTSAGAAHMMARFCTSLWRDERGVLSFEWTLLLTLLTLGIVGGLAGARDAVIDELGDVAEAALNIDQSYSLAEFDIPGLFDTNPSDFTDDGYEYTDCERLGASFQQPSTQDTDS